GLLINHRYTCFFMILLFLSPICFAAKLQVVIPPVINGVTFFSDHSFVEDTNMIKSEVYWENMGSVSCVYKYRIDYYNETLDNLEKITINNKIYIDSLSQYNQLKLMHSSFSDELIFSGGKETIYNYFIPGLNASVDELKYSVQPRIYMCNELVYLAPYEMKFNLKDVSLENDINLDLIHIDNDENYITFFLKSSKNTDVVIIPYKKPFWYDIPVSTINLEKNKANNTQIRFFSPDLETRSRNVTFAFASPDLKKIYAIHTIELKYPEEQQMSFIGILFILALFVIAHKQLRIIFPPKKKAKSKK
ncbi:MAG: hypothetical protein KAQ92_06995, partial [Candidatus Aenigmarchaeota archaeon]|nr:hypothetical protein [Candidatus Aenigmarchaeota archaeon]